MLQVPNLVKSDLVFNERLTEFSVDIYTTLDKLKCELSAWEMERNRDTAKIQWHFQTGDAREKLISLYPTLSSVTF